MKSSDLTINRRYQRSKGLWPNNARTYFIDTILNDFPFPKVVLRDIVNLKTRKTNREIIDGQQRLTTIRDYIDNKFKLSSVSQLFKGLFFDDLDEMYQANFLSYEVSIDLVTSATEEEILEIFRRINSYTLPLNKAEQRHAAYQGEFKWFINSLTERMTPFFENYKVLSLRDISRMMDADLITECCQIIQDGVENRSALKLDKLYKRYNVAFEEKHRVKEKMLMSFAFLKDNFYELFEMYKVPSYQFYSIMGALIYNRYGFPDSKGDFSDIRTTGTFCNNVNLSRDELIRMFAEVDEKQEDGKYSEFVKASISTTHGYKHRVKRIQVLIRALQI